MHAYVNACLVILISYGGVAQLSSSLRVFTLSRRTWGGVDRLSVFELLFKACEFLI